MKKAIALVVVLCTGSVLFAEEEKSAWFDMDHCAICKPMAQDKEAMMRVKWESHKTPVGMLAISVVPDDLKPKMDKAHQEMEKTVKRLEAGEQMELCGYCTSFGSLIEAGAEKTELDTVGGHILMLTSSDPDVVKRIHDHVDKTTVEFNKMVAAQSK